MLATGPAPFTHTATGASGCQHRQRTLCLSSRLLHVRKRARQQQQAAVGLVPSVLQGRPMCNSSSRHTTVSAPPQAAATVSDVMAASCHICNRHTGCRGVQGPLKPT